MKIYRFNHDKIFIGIDEAPECPVTKRKRKLDPKIKKKFLPVRLSTTKPVPEYDVETQYAQFIDDEWVVKDIPIPEPEPEPTIEEAQSITITLTLDELNALVDKKVKEAIETVTIEEIEKVVDDVKE